MALLQCEMCCGELEISPDKSVGVCKYCGSTFTIPKEIEKKGNLFNRANYLRQTCNFDKAISVYESILADNCEDADALWGLVLCRYGIEFVEDPKTHERIPTCHRASRTSILADPDFKSALQFADEEKRNVYRENATRIDQIQKAILAMADSQEKYDVFICYKETDEEGERTIDSVLAQEIYNELTKMKIRTFFARKTLEGKMGSSYEPIIYSALNSAKVMIVLGTKAEHFEATWVKNEWSRYLDFMQDGEDKHLIPAYRGMSAYELPDEFVSIQALDMGRIGFMMDLCDGIKKLLRKDEQEGESGPAPISKDSLYSRAMVFLGNREFYKAVDYFDKVLDIDPQYARAYWGSLLASYQCVTNNELINCTNDDWTEDAHLDNAIRFANDAEKRIYEDTLARRVANFKKLANAALESKDYARCTLWCDKFIAKDPHDGGVWWLKLLSSGEACNSNELFDQCVKSAVSLLDLEAYQNALKYSIPEEAMMYEKVALKIEAAVQERRKAMAYEDCKAYMSAAVSNLRTRKMNSITAQWKDYQQEARAFRTLKENKGKFHRNNIFQFLLKLFPWVLPVCLAVAKMATDGEGNTLKFSLFFGIMFGIVMAIILYVSWCMYIYQSKKTSRLIGDCQAVVEQLEKDKRNIAFTAKGEAQANELYQNFLSHRDLTVEQIEACKAEFEALYAQYNH